MSIRKRQLVSAVLVGSYVLASASAWVHVAHRCGAACQAVSVADWACCAHHHDDAPAKGPRWDLPLSQDDMPQRRDDCTICQFQFTKKLAEFLPAAIPVSTECPETVVPDLPEHRVASLIATPQSRAPPCLT